MADGIGLLPEDVCAECGNDRDVHPLPWFKSLDGPSGITFEIGWQGKRWHSFVGERPVPESVPLPAAWVDADIHTLDTLMETVILRHETVESMRDYLLRHIEASYDRVNTRRHIVWHFEEMVRADERCRASAVAESDPIVALRARAEAAERALAEPCPVCADAQQELNYYAPKHIERIRLHGFEQGRAAALADLERCGT